MSAGRGGAGRRVRWRRSKPPLKRDIRRWQPAWGLEIPIQMASQRALFCASRANDYAFVIRQHANLLKATAFLPKIHENHIPYSWGSDMLRFCTAPRPMVYGATSPADLQKPDNYLSFYSAHTSNAFAAGLAYATTCALRHPTSPVR